VHLCLRLSPHLSLRAGLAVDLHAVVDLRVDSSMGLYLRLRLRLNLGLRLGLDVNLDLYLIYIWS
jgi:hypothetical protein